MLDYFEMLLETAVDEGTSEQTDTNTDSQTETTTVEETTTQTDDEPEVNQNEFDVDGEKVTLEKIREWKQGNMRQSDYTRKTQELASQRNEAKDALEIYDFLKKNPELLEKLAEFEPKQAQKVVSDDVRSLEVKFNTMQIDMQLNQIKSMDKDIDEMAILNIANERKIPVNDAYDIWKGQNFDKIMAKKLAEQSKGITEQIKKNNANTKTLITPGDKTDNKMFGLSQQELEYAAKLDMSPEEYSKWKRH